MARLRPRQTPGFNKAEIQEMEVLYKSVGEESSSQSYCEKLARKFSRVESRAGKPAIQWEQVQQWFKQRQQACKSEVAATQKKQACKSEVAPTRNKQACKSEVAPTQKQLVIPSKKLAATSPSASDSKSESEPEPETETEVDAAPKDEKHTDLSDLEFEAKSTKDGAWYDVSIFLTHRVLSSGEPEVRVRFVGFGAEEDEWVNVKTGVRERSLPMESTECHKVNVGDLVLCFQERRDQAIYYDAHVMDIQRRLHDIRGCRCLFLVRYDHDNSEEKVHLRRICRRPSY